LDVLIGKEGVRIFFGRRGGLEEIEEDGFGCMLTCLEVRRGKGLQIICCFKDNK